MSSGLVVSALHRSLLVCSVLVACRPSGPAPDLKEVGDPAPPQARVIATLTDVGTLAGDPRKGADTDPPGAVLGVEPLEHASTTEPIIVEFATPMEPDRSRVDIELDPFVPGEVTWTAPTRAVFAPKQALHSATTYTVQASGVAYTRAGDPVKVERRWSFETPRPTVALDTDYPSYREGEGDELFGWEAGLTLTLSHDATRAAVRDALSVTAEGRSKPVPYRLVVDKRYDEQRSEPTNVWRILPRGHWPPGAKIRATVAPSLVSVAGPLPSGREVFATMKVRPGLDAEVGCDHEAKDGCVVGGFHIVFDESVPKSVARKISVSPRPKAFKVDPWAWDEDGRVFRRISFYGNFEPDKTYTVRFRGQVRDVKGQSLVGPRSRTVRFVPPPPALDLSAAGTLLSTDKGTFGVETRSLEDATLAVSTLSNAALAELIDRAPEERHRPNHGVETREVELDLKPGGTWGWDARVFDLHKEFGSPTGAAFFEASPGAFARGQAGRADLAPQHALIQLTNLGVTVGKSPAGSFVRVLQLDDAKPVADATAHLFDTSVTPPKKLQSFGPSDAGGFIRISGNTRMRGAMIVQTQDDRVALSLRGPAQGRWRSYDQPEMGQPFDVGVIMADRGIYQPGERMRVMGWVARSSTAHPTGVEGSGTHPVRVELKDGRDRVIAESTVRTKGYGKFWATLDVPESASLGTVSIEATLERGGDNASFSTYAMLREFVAPAFDVALSLEDDQLLHGESTTGRAVARYLHGMALPVQSADQSTSCNASYYAPPTDGDFDVASPVTWGGSTRSTQVDLVETASFEQGLVSFEPNLGDLKPGYPYDCSIALVIRDAARQAVSTRTSLQVHPSRYLLLSRENLDARVGDEHTFIAKALTFDGAGRSTTGAEIRITRGREDGTTDLHSCRLRFDSEGIARCPWKPKVRGRYTVALTGEVDGVPVRTEYSTYVSPAPSKQISFSVDVPARGEVGTPIDVSVQTVPPSATGVLVGVRAGIRSLHPFSTIDHHAKVRLTPDEGWVPRGYVDTLVAYPQHKGRLPQLVSSRDGVELGYASRALTVAIENPDVASTGSTIPIDVAVTDPTGKPVEGAHISVWAVDEGILMLRPWSFPDFARNLASGRAPEARYFHGYGDLRWPYMLRRDPFEPRDGIGLGSVGTTGHGGGSGFGSGHGALGRSSSAPKVRRNFDPAPIFIGDVKTGADGNARVRGMLPDNLTTFRIAAIATAEVPGTGAFVRAGRAESQVRVTQELAVRPVLPRMLRPGDTAVLGLLVDNLANKAGTLELTVELDDADGVLKIVSPAKIRQPITQTQTRVPVEVLAEAPGEVRVRVTAKLVAKDGTVLQDASELPIEVQAERTMLRHAATYGSFTDDEAAAIGLDVPQQHVVGTAEASVDVFTSMLGGYRGAVDTIVQYPYGCVEQTSSRLVPLAALHGLGEYDFGVEDVEAFAKRGVERLASMKTSSGGLAYWPGSNQPHPYATAYAVWVLSELARAGVEVPDDLLDDASEYLQGELGRVRALGTPNTHEDVRASMALLALSTRRVHADDVLDDLLTRQDTLPTFAKAMLLMTLDAFDEHGPRYDALLQSIRARIVLRGETARVKAESTLFTRFFDSPVRTDAMVLLALVRTAPDEPLIEPLARGLTAARDAGQLRNTQENAYALLAMAGYAGLREAVTPDLDVRAWVGPNMVLEAAFEGRDLSLHRGEGAIAGGSPRVTLQRLGAGRLYYRVGMQWAPTPSTIKAHARGLALTRTLYDDSGVLEGGRSMVAGEAGLLEFTITADARQRYVVVDVPLPAGVEAVDRSLGRGGAVRHVSGSRGGAPLPYSRQEIRGDRVVVFVDHLPAGTYRYRVPIRATHEGTFSMPPAVTHAMYAPEIAGNTGATSLRVVSP